MNKKRVPAATAFVRNTEKPKPKTTYISHHGSKEEAKKEIEKPSEQPVSNKEDEKIRFQSPEPNSALMLARKIESLENVKPRKVKSVSSIPVDDKITKLMNFPSDQPIYKNLIPLCSKTQPQPLHPPSRPPLPNKDEEPSLSDFYTPKRGSEYRYRPSIQVAQPSLIRDSDCLRLYRIMQTWSDS